jgi:hypothetical protein
MACLHESLVRTAGDSLLSPPRAEGAVRSAWPHGGTEETVRALWGSPDPTSSAHPRRSPPRGIGTSAACCRGGLSSCKGDR